MIDNLCSGLKLGKFKSGSSSGSCTILQVFLAAALVFSGPGLSHGAGESPAEASKASKMQFPEGTATPSEACGACHQTIYKEYAEGMGSDLRWRSMKFQPSSKTLLSLPVGISRSATAHFVAQIDPFPLEAVKVEEEGRQCNVCHYPQAMEYPDAAVGKIEKPKPRAEHRERGITCASCHLTPEGKIRGPYVVDAPHETVADERSQTSVACAYCHSEGVRVVGKQTQTFLEWREDFNKAGLGRQQCQDCHMPKTVRKLAENFDVPERVVARHTWTGGHSFKRVASALDLSVVQPQEGQPQLSFRVANIGAGHSVPTGSNRRAIYLHADVVNTKGKVVASKEWMFAPWMLGRPDDKKYLEEDRKGGDPVATSQADAQGPHETIIRAGETRVLDWNPEVATGQYTVQTTLIYDLNRYNDRAFKDDQQEIARISIPVKITRSANVSRAGTRAALAGGGALAQTTPK